MLPQNNEIRFEVINICNYKCIICMKGELTRNRSMMETSLFKKLIDKILSETNQYEYVSFAGIGEPLLDHDIINKISYAKGKGLKPLLITNGSLLTADKFMRLQDAGLYSVRVSFHGASPRGYSLLHGISPDDFYNVHKNICEISKIRKTTKLLLACVYVKGVNDEPIEKWINLWKDKADLLEIWWAHNWVNGLDNRKVQECKLKTCGRLSNGPLQIQVDGTVNACCFDWDGKLLFGDLKNKRLKDIFNSAAFDRILWYHLSGDYENSNLICENCDQRNKNKNDILIYSSKFDKKERVKMTSTTYEKVIK